MGLFSKKPKEDFEATKSFMVNELQYDENRQLIKVKTSKDLIPVSAIETYSLTYGSKTFDKVNLGRAIIGGTAFGLVGVVLAGTHKEEYISNIKIMIKANGKFYFLPLTIGKVKANVAEGILKRAEDMILFLDDITK